MWVTVWRLVALLLAITLETKGDARRLSARDLSFFEAKPSVSAPSDFSDMLETTVNFQPTPDFNVSLSGSIANILPKRKHPNDFMDRLLTSLFTGLFTAATPPTSRGASIAFQRPVTQPLTTTTTTTTTTTVPPTTSTTSVPLTVTAGTTGGMPSIRPKQRADGSPGITPEDFLPFSTTRLKPNTGITGSPFFTASDMVHTTPSPPPRPFIGFVKNGNVQFVMNTPRETTLGTDYPVSSPPGMTPLFTTPPTTTRMFSQTTQQFTPQTRLWTTMPKEIPWRMQSLRSEIRQIFRQDTPMTRVTTQSVPAFHTLPTSGYSEPNHREGHPLTQLPSPPQSPRRPVERTGYFEPHPTQRTTVQGPIFESLPVQRPPARDAVQPNDKFYNFDDLKQFFANADDQQSQQSANPPQPQLLRGPSDIRRTPSAVPAPPPLQLPPPGFDPPPARRQRMPVHRQPNLQGNSYSSPSTRPYNPGVQPMPGYAGSPRVVGQTVMYSNNNPVSPGTYGGAVDTGYNQRGSMGYGRNSGYIGNVGSSNQNYQSIQHNYMLALHYGYNVDSYGIQPSTGLTLEQCFLRWPNMVIVNAVPYERTSGLSQPDCLLRCVNSMSLIGIACASIVYIPQTMSCDLFSVSAGVYQDRATSYAGMPASFSGSGRPGSHVFPSNTGGYATQPKPLGYPQQGPNQDYQPYHLSRKKRSYGTGGADLYGVYGMDYYELLNECKYGNIIVSTASPVPGVSTTPSPVTVTPAPTDMQCPVGTTPVFQRAEGYELLGSDGYTVFGITEQQCLDSCRNNMAMDGTQYPCLSSDYDGPTMTCILSTEAASPTRFGILSPAPGKVYYEKTCLTAGLSCPSGFIDRISQQVLRGAGGVVQTAATATECIELCLDSQARLGVACLSASFFYEISEFNCVLSEQSRQTNPGNFVPEVDSRVEYYGLDQCTRSLASINRSPFLHDSIATVHPRLLDALQPPSFAQLNRDDVSHTFSLADESLPLTESVRKTIKEKGYRFFDSPMLGYTWEEWSSCDRKGLGRRVRYRACTGNPRCEVESEWCVGE